MANKNTLTLLLVAIITSFGLFISPAFAAAPGTWSGTAEFGTFELIVNAQGTEIERVNLTFSNWTCGPITHVSGGVGIIRTWPPITNDSFSITFTFNSQWDQEMTISGTFNSATQASGTWQATSQGTVCSDGTWQATNDGGADPEAFTINAAISDAWFFPPTGGQGFFIMVWEDRKEIFLAWFTYDTERPPEDVMAILGEPGHRWLTGQGPYEGDTALLDVFLTSGMVFDSAVPPADSAQLEGATIKIVWIGCNEGLVEYNIPTLGLSNAIPIERIVPDNIAACEAAQAQ